MAEDKTKSPSLSDLLEKAKEMQKQMQEAQDELSRIELEGKAGVFGKGFVKIAMSARYEARRAEIDDAAMQNKEILEDLVVAAINDATRKIEKTSRGKVMDLTKKMGLPTEMPNLPDEEASEE